MFIKKPYSSYQINPMSWYSLIRDAKVRKEYAEKVYNEREEFSFVYNILHCLIAKTLYEGYVSDFPPFMEGGKGKTYLTKVNLKTTTQGYNYYIKEFQLNYPMFSGETLDEVIWLEQNKPLYVPSKTKGLDIYPKSNRGSKPTKVWIDEYDSYDENTTSNFMLRLRSTEGFNQDK